ncbi:hypothetical protein EDE15_3355 [Edaphobacter aggregans]|uniref:Uncharacterized protein n=1 Tax=Edaphobacter aggregans TaxID=570835 RepID=A0A3R9PTY5_9BACT|nr:hypothetical protein [Edaphobacter aggregans]RSL17806.1 hypothetical protein EDE15_3355 [Edaphobacter aggregans]
MVRLDWRVVEGAAGLLGCEDREAVLGDLVEAGEGAWRGLLDVLGLVVRRQTELWRSWRPWVAALGVALPFSFLLMGFSVSVSLGYRQVTLHGGWLGLAGRAVLLVVLAWASGFVVGSVSRRTLWVSVVATLSPCLFCLARFRIASLSRGCLLLFVLPAVLGVWWGLRGRTVGAGVGLMLALGVSMGMGLWGGWWGNWFLVWPVWYLVVLGRGDEKAYPRG